jgi:molybdate transport system ATP-binding protein
MFFSIRNMSIQVGDFHLKDISLDIEEGDYVAIIGPTGSGKSILLESIIGFFNPDQGHFYLQGHEITNELPEKRHIGIVYQDYALLPHFTVLQNISYGLKKIQKHGIETKVYDIARSLQIDHLLTRKPDTLSGGEQQRTALARALAVEPKLLLMDEPFSALDPVTSSNLRLLLKNILQRQQTTVVHVTHNIDDVWALANKAAVLHQGKLLQFDTRENIFQRPSCKHVADLVEASLFQGQVIEQGQNTTAIRFNGFTLLSRDKPPAGTEVTVAVRPESIAVSRTPSGAETTNVLQATIKDVLFRGVIGTLLLQVGDTVIPVHSTQSTIQELSPAVRDTVYISIGYDAVNIIGNS